MALMYSRAAPILITKSFSGGPAAPRQTMILIRQKLLREVTHEIVAEYLQIRFMLSG